MNGKVECPIRLWLGEHESIFSPEAIPLVEEVPILLPVARAAEFSNGYDGEQNLLLKGVVEVFLTRDADTKLVAERKASRQLNCYLPP